MTIFPDFERELVELAARMSATDRARRSRRSDRRLLGGVMTAIAAVVVRGCRRSGFGAAPHGPTTTTNPSGEESSSALVALHAQSGQLLGSGPGLESRVQTLHGLPVVINVWASWCPPCREDFAHFASASLRYGSQMAFLGADLNDTRRAARAFLAERSVGYPSDQKLRSSSPPSCQDSLKVCRAYPRRSPSTGPGGSCPCTSAHTAHWRNSSVTSRSTSSRACRTAAPLGSPSRRRARNPPPGPDPRGPRFNTGLLVERSPAQAPPRHLLPALTRLVALPDGGKLFLYVAPLTAKPATSTGSATT